MVSTWSLVKSAEKIQDCGGSDQRRGRETQLNTTVQMTALAERAGITQGYLQSDRSDTEFILLSTSSLLCFLRAEDTAVVLGMQAKQRA